MTVIVLILKIVGIVLLVLLALLFLVLFLVLGIPVRYRILGTMDERVSVQVKVTWLLRLVSFSAVYADGELETILRICGIRKKEKPTDETDIEAEAKEDIVQESAQPAVVSTQDVTREMLPESQEPVTAEGQGTPNVYAEKAKKHAHRGIGSRVRAYFAGFRKKIFQIKKQLLAVFTQASSVRAMLTDEANSLALAGIFREIKYLLRHFRFRRCKADVRFGLGDPAATGQALGAISVLPFIYRYPCCVVPDFESEDAYLLGSIQIVGWARGAHAVISLLRLLMQREVRAMAKKVLRK